MAKGRVEEEVSYNIIDDHGPVAERTVIVFIVFPYLIFDVILSFFLPFLYTLE